MNAQYVMCITNRGYLFDLTVHKVYKIIPDPKAEQRKLIRIVDDSGEDYLHSASRFVSVELSEEAVRKFELVVV